MMYYQYTHPRTQTNRAVEELGRIVSAQTSSDRQTLCLQARQNKAKRMESNDDSNNRLLGFEDPKMSGRVGAGSALAIQGKVLVRKLDLYFSYPTNALEAQHCVRRAKGALRIFDPFAPEERPTHIRAFHNFRAKIRPTIENFISAHGTTSKALLESSRRFREGPGGEAFGGASYVLASEYFECFMRLMRAAEDSRSPRRAGGRSQQSHFSTAGAGSDDEMLQDAWLERSLALGDRNNALIESVSEPVASDVESPGGHDLMDMSSTFGTDMAVASPSGLLDAMPLFARGEDNSGGDAQEIEYLRENSALFNSVKLGVSDSDSSHGGSYDGDDDFDGNDFDDDDCSDEGSAGSEEIFTDPDPSDPIDGGLPCMERPHAHRGY